ncbi:hypothetical protein TEA_005160 [Camellia sinensis var. sinensis]|uniref:Uncharacterized protein n=1 Tax=Camellia sinensis var. sinensis TaxID=542762 RepID=A0A4S4DWE1_CAMSN|nr:hypothetical protein TEA_005160 [Camellia sinensis var. sinensis]
MYRSRSFGFDVELVSSSISNQADSDRHELQRLFGGANRSSTTASVKEEGCEDTADTRASDDVEGSSDQQRQWQGNDGRGHQLRQRENEERKRGRERERKREKRCYVRTNLGVLIDEFTAEPPPTIDLAKIIIFPSRVARIQYTSNEYLFVLHKRESCSSVDSEEFEPEALVDSGVAHRQDNSEVKTGLEEAHRDEEIKRSSKSVEHPPSSLAVGKKRRSFQNQETHYGPSSLPQIPQNNSPLLHLSPPQRHRHSLRRTPAFLRQHPHYPRQDALSFLDIPTCGWWAPYHVGSGWSQHSMRFKMPRIPCINHPPVDFDYDFESNGDNGYVVNCDCINDDDGARKSFLKSGDEIDREVCEEMIIACDDEGIDIKAEQFIAKFYEQMKMQRQVSYLQYNEMINRGTS